MDANSRPNKEWSCPALGMTISRKECASRRISEIACSPDCPNNPFGFAAYSQLRELESRWFDKALRRAKSIRATPQSIPSFTRSGHIVFQEMAEVEFVMTTLLGKGPIAANTPFEQWAADPAAALSNDECLVTRFRAQSRATVVEIQRRLQNDTCLAIDVFEPDKGEFVIFHPSLSKSFRYSRHFGWFTWYPHFAQPLGHMMELVPHLWFAWKDEVLHEFKNRRNIDYSTTLQGFLRGNFCRACDLVGALAQQ